MEFGFFGDLPETDQAHIKEILYNNAKGACKGGKQPEFSWIKLGTRPTPITFGESDLDNPELSRVEETEADELVRQTEIISQNNAKQEVLQDHHQLPTEMAVQQHSVPVNVMPVQGPPIGYPVPGFTPCPVNFYSQGFSGLIPHPNGGMGMVPFVCMPHMAYGMAPVPVSISQEQAINISAMQQNYDESEVICKEPVEIVPSLDYQENVQDMKSDDCYNENSVKMTPKTYERRNKKRRPPDYYQKLAEQQDNIFSNTESDKSLQQDQSDTYVVTHSPVLVNQCDIPTTEMQSDSSVAPLQTVGLKPCQGYQHNTDDVHVYNDNNTNYAAEIPTLNESTSHNFPCQTSPPQEAHTVPLQPSPTQDKIIFTGNDMDRVNSNSMSQNTNDMSPGPDETQGSVTTISEDSNHIVSSNNITQSNCIVHNDEQKVITTDMGFSNDDNVINSSNIIDTNSRIHEFDSVAVISQPFSQPQKLIDTSLDSQPQQSNKNLNKDNIVHTIVDVPAQNQTESPSSVESVHSSDIKIAPKENIESTFVPPQPVIKSTDSTQIKPAQEQVIPPKKPNSWAGLFSSTQQAKNATVIYTSYNANSKNQDCDQVSNTGDSKLEEKIRTVISPSEDSLTKQIGDVLLNHRLNHKVVSLQPRGLRNRRNWCYISATLQALIACPPFYHLMKALPYVSTRIKGPSSTPVMDSLCEFVNQFSLLSARTLSEAGKALNGKGTLKMDMPQGPTFEPTCVYDVLKTSKYASAFMCGRQEDAEEFLSSFLNGLHDEMVACMKSDKSTETSSDKICNGVSKPENDVTEVVEEDEGWEQVGPKNKAVVTRATHTPVSPISQLFQGQMRSILHQAGVRESATLQPFFTLQLDIQSDKVLNVKDALEGLVRKESLQDFTCTKTKQEVEATRRITLEELPPVLILHLKYFLYDKSGGCQKLSKQLDFGVDLEISKDLLSPNMKSKLSQSQRKYKLFGVVNHHGPRAIGGHYTAYVYHSGIGGWIHIDDEIVRTVNVSNVVKYNPPRVPYLLYYRKVDIQQ